MHGQVPRRTTSYSAYISCGKKAEAGERKEKSRLQNSVFGLFNPKLNGAHVQPIGISYVLWAREHSLTTTMAAVLKAARRPPQTQLFQLALPFKDRH
ncbi:hypothetical protein LshimejAT787_0704770 [Lyophyllum shimeji]|uniref:Uncharacterized protein n=1 Tax=Lyophyllum shimeji TaxID=47721 RepID=A0A9P3PP01_LYOSH|nr:hypothetical protein LshimejAT787_0704770 [Lyophyllum shimeji]